MRHMKKIWDERKEDREDGDPYAFQVITEDTPEQTNAALLKRLNLNSSVGLPADAAFAA